MAKPWERNWDRSDSAGGKPWERNWQDSAPAPADGAPQPERSLSDRAGDLWDMSTRALKTSLIDPALNLQAGVIRGAGSIGATALAPVDVAKDAMAGKGLTLESNRERRAAMDSGLQELLGADPQSIPYQVGKLTGEIAGTAGGGSVLAGGAKAAGASPAIVSGLQSGGLNVAGRTGAGGLLTRAATGATTGALAAGMTNPEEAGAGAVIGGALPVVTQGLGRAGQAIGAQLKPADDRAELARVAIDRGAPIGIADITDGAFTKGLRSTLNDAWLTGGIGAAQKDAKQLWFNRAVGEVFDAADDKLTPQVMDSAKKKMGEEFDRIWGNNSLVVDQEFTDALAKLRKNADMLTAPESRRINNLVDDLQSKIQVGPNGQPVIPGDIANRFQSSIRKTSESADGFLRNELADLRKEVISAFNRSVSPEDAAALALNQKKYKAYKTVEPLLEKGELGVAGREAGDVPAALLPAAVFNSYRGNVASSPLADLSKIGSQFLVDRAPQTGGSARAALQNTAIGLGLGAGALTSPAAAIGVIPFAMATNKALGSPRVARALLNAKAPKVGGLLGLGQKAAPLLSSD